MDISISDSEKVTLMTKNIHDDAQKSSTYAKEISEVDHALSDIIKDIMRALHGSSNAITNEEFSRHLLEAKEAHEKWIGHLKLMVDEMKVYPIQTNAAKCAFGHFYSSMEVTFHAIVEDWKDIDHPHHQLHFSGKKVIKAVEEKNKVKALEDYQTTKSYSDEVMILLEKIIKEVDIQTLNKVDLFKNAIKD